MSSNKISTKKLVFLSLMVGYSLILYIIETFIPNPMMVMFPGAKLGLSNIITMVCLMTIGLKDTFIVLSVRIIISSIFAGPMSYFLFSIAGGYLSLAVMYIISRIKGFSIIGISISGALAHNIGQLLVASFIIKNLMMVSYLPFMLVASIATGVFVGIVSKFMIPYTNRIIDNKNPAK